MTKKTFPDNFIFGAATASLQIEGGDRNNSWYDWCEAKKIPNGDHCIEANDHWNRIAEDVQLMKDLNLTGYRLSIEWSRIQPTKETWDEAAIQHYRDEIIQLKQAGIEPMVTLHHFSNPSWFEKQNAWLNKECIPLFLAYTEFVVKHLGDLVSHWVTINEPNVYLMMGYFVGIFPPGKEGDIKSYLKGAKHMIAAHCQSYTLIHKLRNDIGKKDTQIGAALHLRVFDVSKHSFLAKISQKICYFLFQDLFFNGMLHGKWFGRKLHKGTFFDYLGINYYSRDILKPNIKAFPIFADITKPEGCEVNDLDWEIYPEGLARVIRKYYEKCKLPIHITENGIADSIDQQRKKYLHDHLNAVHTCIQEGIPVKGYFHWTLIDNFEWMEGYEARFGLYAHDVATQERSLRASGKYYSKICKSKQLLPLNT